MTTELSIPGPGCCQLSGSNSGLGEHGGRDVFAPGASKKGIRSRRGAAGLSGGTPHASTRRPPAALEPDRRVRPGRCRGRGRGPEGRGRTGTKPAGRPLPARRAPRSRARPRPPPRGARGRSCSRSGRPRRAPPRPRPQQGRAGMRSRGAAGARWAPERGGT